MQDFQELMPDEETFRRVWQRVMPDESISPIAVGRPGEAPSTPAPQPVPTRPGGDEGLLRQMLEELDEALANAGVLVRRQPGARGLWESLNGSASQLRAAWFLLTGRRWMTRPRGNGWNLSTGQLLREAYLRELEQSRLYRTGEQVFQGEDLRELMPELEQAARQRRGMIRRMLAQR